MCVCVFKQTERDEERGYGCDRRGNIVNNTNNNDNNDNNNNKKTITQIN